MPTPDAESPIQRVPSGLPGPGGVGFSPTAHGAAGGYHHGFFHLTITWKCPSGVGYVVWPVATPKTRRSRFAPRWMTITGPQFLRVIFAGTVFAFSRTVSRVFATSRRVIVRTASARR